MRAAKHEINFQRGGIQNRKIVDTCLPVVQPLLQFNLVCLCGIKMRLQAKPMDGIILFVKSQHKELVLKLSEFNILVIAGFFEPT